MSEKIIMKVADREITKNLSNQNHLHPREFPKAKKPFLQACSIIKSNSTYQ